MQSPFTDRWCGRVTLLLDGLSCHSRVSVMVIGLTYFRRKITVIWLLFEVHIIWNFIDVLNCTLSTIKVLIISTNSFVGDFPTNDREVCKLYEYPKGFTTSLTLLGLQCVYSAKACWFPMYLYQIAQPVTHECMGYQGMVNLYWHILRGYGSYTQKS